MKLIMFTETIRTHKKMKMMMLTQNISGLCGICWLVGLRSMETNDPSPSKYPRGGLFMFKEPILSVRNFGTR